MATNIKSRIQIRRDTASAWSSENPTLLAGEIGYDSTNNAFKVGDGSTAWNLLEYLNVYDENVKVGSGTLAEILEGVDVYTTASDTAKLSALGADGTGAEFKKIATKKYVDDAVSAAVEGAVDAGNVSYTADVGEDGYTTVEGALDGHRTLISNEVTARGAADTYLSGAISSEVTARGAADDYISGVVSGLAESKQDNLGFALSAAGDAYDKTTNPVTTKHYVDNEIAGVLANLASTVTDQLVFVGALTGTQTIADVDGLYGTGKRFNSPECGHIVLVGTKEYVYDGSTWQLFGDESAYATVGDKDVLSAALTAEANTRGADDTYLSGAISSEVTARGNADTYLSGAISSEVTARGEADEYISGVVSGLAESKQDNLGFALSGAGDAYDKTNNPVTTKNYVDAAIAELNSSVDGLSTGDIAATDLTATRFSGKNTAKAAFEVLDADLAYAEARYISAITVGGVAGSVSNNAVTFSFDTAISSNSTSVNAPTTKAVYDALDALETSLDNAKVDKTTTVAGFALSGDISAADLFGATAGLSAVTLNGASFTVADHAASLSINIDGGNAAGTGLPA